MPPQRRPLGPVDGNKDSINASRSVIRRSIALDILNTIGASLLRPGRPIIYSPRDKESCFVIFDYNQN
ncbi:hypothetical protein D0Z07_7816 [Hyphodiscus hymeniophilus]|uniref:Uncharacterized protein n=1 Tax=Hyphodiscus hymeniophilus TaxID=353542 RepID=A0A9P6SQV2_9HELO|nr:hypothetical protein D0Z07_7816 [Hyphodiscus hymeniophilus]